MSNTALALEPFGSDYSVLNRVELTCVSSMLLTTIQILEADGSTPMAEAMNYVINTYNVTRCVLVSDGEPDRKPPIIESAFKYKEAGIQCDCVHIGTGNAGEAILRKIAEITEGQFIKFTDINNFAHNFKYLTPAYYAQLTSGSINADHLGAAEIK